MMIILVKDFRLHSFCADIYVRLFTVCFCCLLFLYFPKMLWWEWPPAHFAFRSQGNNKANPPPSRKKRRKKKIKIEKSPWYQLWLYCMCKLIDSLTYLWDVFWKFYVLVCLFVCLFVQFSLSVCANAQTQTRFRAT